MGIVVSIIGWLIFGLIVGAIARFILPGRQSMSYLMTAILGIVGSFVGGGIYAVFAGSADFLSQPGGWVLSILGAFIVLFVYSKVAESKSAA